MAVILREIDRLAVRTYTQAGLVSLGHLIEGENRGDTSGGKAVELDSLWGTFRQVGSRKYRNVERFWTYDPQANPTGFGYFDAIVTVSEDGKTYHGEGPSQFFDNNGNPLGPAAIIADDGTRIRFS